MRLAFSCCFSMRSWRVPSERWMSHAVSGSLLEPRMVRITLISSTSWRLPMAIPATRSEWPPKNFVAEYSTRSAPSARGRMNTGPMNVLSTSTRIFRSPVE